MKNAFIILGNGFSIDFLQHYETIVDTRITDRVDVRNLFRLGDKISSPWNTKPSFLSYKTCPALWMLGARPGNTAEESTALIEEIITCANMFFDFVNEPGQKEKRLEMASQGNDRLYLRAYSELIVYLRHLFSCYDSAISDSDLHSFIEQEHSWGWLEFFKSISDKRYNKITVITYNYDIWLERILKTLEVPFFISGFDAGTDGAVEIIKPHGSISFVPKDSIDSTYSINYNLDFGGSTLDQLALQYCELKKYDKGAIIPPAGDSSRLETTAPWSHMLKQKATEIAKQIGSKDDVVLCGVSYWHVDRREIDELLINLNQDVDFTFINPSPPRDLNAVLISIFKNYVHQSSSSHIGGILNGKTI